MPISFFKESSEGGKHVAFRMLRDASIAASGMEFLLLDPSVLIRISLGGVLLALSHHLPFWCVLHRAARELIRVWSRWLRFSRYDTVRAEWNIVGNTGWISAAVAWGILLAQLHTIVMMIELVHRPYLVYRLASHSSIFINVASHTRFICCIAHQRCDPLTAHDVLRPSHRA